MGTGPQGNVLVIELLVLLLAVVVFLVLLRVLFETAFKIRLVITSNQCLRAKQHDCASMGTGPQGNVLVIERLVRLLLLLLFLVLFQIAFKIRLVITSNYCLCAKHYGGAVMGIGPRRQQLL